ncbi:MAG: hypothetical protein HON90_15710 [Halobacteriovoraceae bacterium]|nr:hypothetical protein [Halobacteriovoraceae bacterium]
MFIAKPFSGEQKVIKYLGRYMHKTAISNSRILDVNKEKREVIFQYKNYKSGDLNSQMTLDLDVFLKRFSNCLLSKGLASVRHSGAYGNTVKKENVFRARLKVYGEYCKPVEVLKEVYKIENRIKKIIDSISICGKCFCAFTQKPIQSSA